MRSPLRAILTCCALAVTGAQASQGDARDIGPVIEEVVVMVGKEFLTRSELELEARVALIRRGGMQAAFAPLGDDVMRAALEHVVNELLIVQEMDRLRVFDVGLGEVEAEMERFEGAFDSDAFDAFLAAGGFGRERVAVIFRRNLRVRRYLESRVRFEARVQGRHLSPTDVGIPSGSEDELSASDPMRSRQAEASISALLGALRARGDVRYLAPAGGGASASKASSERIRELDRR